MVPEDEITHQNLRVLTRNDRIKKIIRTIFYKKQKEEFGASISEISRNTGIERHSLSGILEVLKSLKLLNEIQIGMNKIFIINPKALPRIKIFLK